MESYERLEGEWAEFNELEPENMVACSSGTAALHLALETLHLPPRSEVLVPDFTMVACPRAVTLAGLTPVFVDCDDRLLMDQELSEENEPIGGNSIRTSTVMRVHVYGRTAPIWRRDTLGYKLIEDLAEAHGVRPSTQSDAACWSFYKNKIIAGEEGGAVWFRDREAATYARKLRSLGFTESHDFYHHPRGHNYRMANCLADLILTNLAMYEMYKWGVIRRTVEALYDHYCPEEWRMPERDAVWVYDLKLPAEVTWEKQSKIVAKLNAEGIAARHAFKPMSVQKEFDGCRLVGFGKAMEYARRVIYLPVKPAGHHSQPYTKTVDIKKSFDIIHSFF